MEYPHSIHLIRGNHEAADINALFGFRIECIERMVMCYFYVKILLSSTFTNSSYQVQDMLNRVREMGFGHGIG